jgi:hypothetical protein
VYPDFSLVIVRDGIEFPAPPARLPPLGPSPLTTAMPALVRERSNKLKVLDSVVELVIVAMMDFVSRRNRPVVGLPNKNVLHAVASLSRVVDAAVTLGGNTAVSTRS